MCEVNFYVKKQKNRYSSCWLQSPYTLPACTPTRRVSNDTLLHFHANESISPDSTSAPGVCCMLDAFRKSEKYYENIFMLIRGVDDSRRGGGR